MGCREAEEGLPVTPDSIAFRASQAQFQMEEAGVRGRWEQGLIYTSSGKLFFGGLCEESATDGLPNDEIAVCGTTKHCVPA